MCVAKVDTDVLEWCVTLVVVILSSHEVPLASRFYLGLDVEYGVKPIRRSDSRVALIQSCKSMRPKQLASF